LTDFSGNRSVNRGIPRPFQLSRQKWIPAFAGMTHSYHRHSRASGNPDHR